MPKTRIILVAAAGLVAALGGLFFIRNLIDFPVYYTAGRSLIAGRTDLYAADFALGRVMDYRYPPFFLLALFPLWMIPYKVAAYVWYSFSILEIVGCAWLLNKTIGLTRGAMPPWAWAVVFFAVAPYFVLVLHYGNAHLLAVLFLFACCHLSFSGRPALAGLTLAIAISIKLTPVLFVPYFAVKRQWRLLGWVVGFLAAINLAPAAYFGMARNNELLEGWFQHVVVSQEFHETNGPINLSLKGQLRRLLSDVDYTQRVDGDVDYPAINVASLPQRWVDRLWLGVSGLVCLGALGLIFFRGRRKGPSDGYVRFGSPGDYAIEIALMICVLLFVGPLTSKIYFIALLWPVASLAAISYRRSHGDPRGVGRLLIVIAAVSAVLPLLPGRSLQRFLLVLGADFYLNLALMLAAAYALRSTARLAPEQSAEPQTPSPSIARTS